MKKTISIILSVVLVFAMTAACFAAAPGQNSVTINATVPDSSYTINIPSNVEITDANHEFAEIGLASVSNVAHIGSSQTISYVATGTDFSDGNGNTMTATYYTTENNSPAKNNSTQITGKEIGSITVYTNGASVQTATKICVGIDDRIWSAAAAGTYTATLTYAFSVNNPQ